MSNAVNHSMVRMCAARPAPHLTARGSAGLPMPERVVVSPAGVDQLLTELPMRSLPSGADREGHECHRVHHMSFFSRVLGRRAVPDKSAIARGW